MNTPKSMQSKVFGAACPTLKKKMWQFKNSRERGEISDLPNIIKPTAFRSKTYQWGPYQGTLDEIKEFARTKGKSFLTLGAIKIKVS